jgi:hypothetical protein
MPKAKRKTVPADDGGEIVWRSQVVHPRPALASGALLLIAIEPTVAQRAASNAQAATRRARRTAQSRWSSPGGPPETSPRGSHEASLFSSTSVRRTAQSEPGVLRSPGGPVQVVQSRWSTRDPALASSALLLIAIEPTVAQRAASNAQAGTSEPCDRTQSRWSVLRRGRTGLHMSAANSRE